MKRKLIKHLSGILLILTMNVCLIFIRIYASDSIERSGFFTVKGTAVSYRNDEPISNKKIFIVEIEENGEYTVGFDGEGKIKAPGSGETDINGVFQIKVDRKYFKGNKIKFVIGLRSIGMPILKDKKGFPQIFEVDEKTELIDLDKDFGNIIIKD